MIASRLASTSVSLPDALSRSSCSLVRKATRSEIRACSSMAETLMVPSSKIWASRVAIADSASLRLLMLITLRRVSSLTSPNLACRYSASTLKRSRRIARLCNFCRFKFESWRFLSRVAIISCCSFCNASLAPCSSPCASAITATLCSRNRTSCSTWARLATKVSCSS